MKLVVANHKMNLSIDEIRRYKIDLEGRIRKDLEVVICPSMPYLPLLESDEYKLGSQNVGFQEKGALTGETAAFQLKQLQVAYCLVGHSERRQKLHETTEHIIAKVKCLIAAGITPILCIGETQEEKALHKTELVLEKELVTVWNALSEEERNTLVIAYEPIWAIGSGVTPRVEEIDQIVHTIHEIIERHFYHFTNRVLYGGSINEENVQALETIPSLDGYLIGGSSLNAKQFLNILNRMN